MPLFGVAVIMQPTKKEREEGQTERLVFGPEWTDRLSRCACC